MFSAPKKAPSATPVPSVVGGLPFEIWVMVLDYLEPHFLINVFRVCKTLNHIGKSNYVFNPKLKRYFPEHMARRVDNFANSENQAYEVFVRLYSVMLRGLRSGLAKRLLFCILENDLEQIILLCQQQVERSRLALSRSVVIPSDELLEMMLTQSDVEGVSILTRLSRQNNQRLRDTVFNHTLEQYQLNPDAALGLLDCLWIFLGVQDRTQNIYMLAGALNQLRYIQEHHPEKIYSVLGAWHAAIEHGHLDVVKHLHPLIPEEKYYDTHPLLLAAKHNRPEVVKFILLVDMDRCPEGMIKFAFYEAAGHGAVEALQVLAPYRANLYPLDFPYRSAEHACIKGHLPAFIWLASTYPQIISQHYLSFLEISTKNLHAHIVNWLCGNERFRDPEAQAVANDLLKWSCICGLEEMIGVFLRHHCRPPKNTCLRSAKHKYLPGIFNQLNKVDEPPAKRRCYRPK